MGFCIGVHSPPLQFFFAHHFAFFHPEMATRQTLCLTWTVGNVENGHASFAMHAL
jgi:hypothetical protein